MNKPTILLTTLIATILVGFGCKKPTPPVKNYAPLIPENSMVVSYGKGKDLYSGAMGKFLISEGERQYQAAEKLKSENPESVPSMVLPPKDYFEFCRNQFEKFDWCIFTMGTPNDDFIRGISDEESVELPDFSMVFCSSQKTSLESVEKEFADGFRFVREYFANALADMDCEMGLLANVQEMIRLEKTEVAGCKVFQISFKDEFIDESDMPLKNVCSCGGVYDEKLLIVTSSPKAFENTVALYNGTVESLPENDPIVEETFRNNSAFFFGVYGLDKMIDRVLEILYAESAQIEEIKANAKEELPINKMNYAIAMDDAEMALKFTATVGFLTEAFAADIHQKANSMLPLGVFALSGMCNKNPSLSFLKDIWGDIKLSNQGKDVMLDFQFKKEIFEKLDYYQLAKDALAYQKEQEQLYGCGYPGSDFDEDEDDFDENEEEEEEEEEVESPSF